MVSMFSFLSNISLTEISPDVRVPVGEVSVFTSFLKEISPRVGLFSVIGTFWSGLGDNEPFTGWPTKGINSTKSVKLFFFRVRF